MTSHRPASHAPARPAHAEPGTALTTVKVTTRTRERLSARAREDGVTIGQLLDRLLHEEDRTRRFEAVADAYRRTADGVYRRETADWDVTLSDGGTGSDATAPAPGAGPAAPEAADTGGC